MKGQSGLKSVNLYCNTVKFSMETDFNYKTSFERKDKISFFNIWTVVLSKQQFLRKYSYSYSIGK